MPITKYDPFRDLERFFEDDFFGFVPAVRRHLEPSMDIYQTDKELVVELQVPKLDPKDIKVTVEDNVLRVEGGSDETQDEKGRQYLRREIKRGKFVRMLSLPVGVKEDGVRAAFEHGVLKITLPKAEESKPKAKEIEIEVR
ncbi:MAG TPA: Hsp20/alpha crystallin family protein [Candidatus Paceibacterota bacterium]|nr:Hsp20/alpha crystallin family protein [Candidatus Paceibacterota bacterium]